MKKEQSLQKKSEWENEFDRRWDYNGTLNEEGTHEELKTFIKEAISNREKEIAKEVKKLKSKEKTSIHDFSYDMAITDVLSLLKH